MAAVLGRYARSAIAARGVKVNDYIVFVNGSDPPAWHGDRCGCPDDRCLGYHHTDAGDEWCGCLPAVLDQMLGEGVWANLPNPT